MPLSWVNKLVLICVMTAVMALPFPARAESPYFSTPATHAFAWDFSTGAIMFAKDPDGRMVPSSMTKIMTLYILFDRLHNGQLTLESTFPVSEKAWKMGGSKMFVKVGDNVSIEDLIRGIIIQSGNDACIVVAEGISGSEEAFAEEMNRVAKTLGMNNTHFLNSTGWPEEEHYTTPRDLVKLSAALIANYNEHYEKYFREKDFTYNKIKQPNRNPLLKKDPRIDGIKTGHTEAGGYGMVASGIASTNTMRRIVTVINGLKNEKQREEEAWKLYTHAAKDFDIVRFFAKDEKVADVKVWFGEEKTVPLVTNVIPAATLSRFKMDELKVTAEFDEPVQAPVIKGAELGRLVVQKPGEVDSYFPLYAAKDVRELSFYRRLKASLNYFLSGSYE